MTDYADPKQTLALDGVTWAPLTYTFEAQDEFIMLRPHGDHISDIELAETDGGAVVEICPAGSTEYIGPISVGKFPKFLKSAAATNATFTVYHINAP